MPDAFDPEERVRSIFDRLRAGQTEPASAEPASAEPASAEPGDSGPTTTEPADREASTTTESRHAEASTTPAPGDPEASTTTAPEHPEASTTEPGASLSPNSGSDSSELPPGEPTETTPDEAPLEAVERPSRPDAVPPAGSAPFASEVVGSEAGAETGGIPAQSDKQTAPGAEAQEQPEELPVDLPETTKAAAPTADDLPGLADLGGLDLPELPDLPAPAQPDGNGKISRFGTRIHPASEVHALPRCLAVANQKGGVGKTTTTVNLGAALAEIGYRVLVVDLDPQGNATTGLGVNARNLDSSVYDVILHDVPVEDVIEPTSIRNLFVVPATIDLAGAEIELVPVFSREMRLRRALEPVGVDFDFILIDCPPSLGLLTVNALAAAGEVLVPIQCEYYALEGLGQLLRNVGLVQGNLNNDLDVSTIVLTMYDARTKLAEQVADDVREHFGERVCRNVVPRTVRLSEAPSFGQPIITFDPSSRGAIAYRELAKEVSGGAPQRVG